MVIFTSICTNYIHKAKILAESVKRHIPNAIFIICLVEREVPTGMISPFFDQVVLAKDSWNGNFNRFIFKHTIVEASTSVKGQFFRYLLEAYPNEDMFIYLDPDICVYDDFTELRALLRKRPIILCPHLLQPGNIDMELSSTAHGVYNLGFLAINRSKEAQRFINWWAERLYLFCYDDIQRGIFTDQKWIDLAPCFFDVEIFKHRGYNFGTWSLLNCEMNEVDGKQYIKGEPLRFIHYSGYGETLNKCMNDWLPKNIDHPFKKLFSEYERSHIEHDASGISKTQWSYATYTSGRLIIDKARKMYREDYEIMFSMEDPFQMSNRYFCKKNNICKILDKTLEKYRAARRIIESQGYRVLFKKVVRKVFKIFFRR